MKVSDGVGNECLTTVIGFKSLGSDALNSNGLRGSAAVKAEAVLGILQKSKAVGKGGVTLEIRNGERSSEFF